MVACEELSHPKSNKSPSMLIDMCFEIRIYDIRSKPLPPASSMLHRRHSDGPPRRKLDAFLTSDQAWLDEPSLVESQGLVLFC